MIGRYGVPSPLLKVFARFADMNSPSETLEVREVTRADAAELALLLNAIIAKGGTTALETPFTAAELEQTYLLGPDVHCCFVAVDPTTERLAGFQTLGRYPTLPDDIGDIGTFTRVGGAQRGVGSALFAATRARARALGLSAINATIRADNAGGLAYYRKQGFLDHGVSKDVPLKAGPPIDRIIKRYALRSIQLSDDAANDRSGP